MARQRRHLRQRYRFSRLLLHSRRAVLISTLGLISACSALPDAGIEPPDPYALPTLDGQSMVPPAIGSTEILTLPEDFQLELDQRFGRIGNPKRRADSLLDYLFDTEDQGLGIRYQYNPTLTATQVLETRRGNCLSIANLLIASARHLGLTAYYQEVDSRRDWNRVGSVLFLDRHINVRITGLGNGLEYEVELLPGPNRTSSRPRVIDDRTAFGHFFNNLAAEAMAESHDRLALDNFSLALQQDSRLAFVWSNLGVLYLRNGIVDAAEASLLQAVSLNGREYAALNTLSRLYENAHKRELAQLYDGKARNVREQNPYWLASLAESALQANDPAHALELIGRALTLDDGDYSLHLVASHIFLMTGQESAARSHYTRATQQLASVGLEPAPDEAARMHELGALLGFGI